MHILDLIRSAHRRASSSRAAACAVSISYEGQRPITSTFNPPFRFAKSFSDDEASVAAVCFDVWGFVSPATVSPSIWLRPWSPPGPYCQ